jgi:hypothetical protein
METNKTEMVLKVISDLRKEQFDRFAVWYLGEEKIFQMIKDSLESDKSGDNAETAKDLIEYLFPEKEQDNEQN